MTKFILQVLCTIICFSAFCTFAFSLSSVSAICNENQIDINTASLSELDKLIGIGPALAQRIIDARSFSSVDDLIKVSGIGNVTLDKIKQQNLACVSSEEEDNQKESDENETLSKNIFSSQEDSPLNSSIPEVNPQKGEVINLSKSQTSQTKDIKSKKLEFNSEKLLIYGLITFGLLIVVLFLLRKLKKLKNQKTEFD